MVEGRAKVEASRASNRVRIRTTNRASVDRSRIWVGGYQTPGFFQVLAGGHAQGTMSSCSLMMSD